MLLRFGVAGLLALAIAMASAPVDAAAPARDEGYEFWDDCKALPNSFVFLPYYLGSDAPGFVDLGWAKVMGNASYQALQATRDKDFGVTRAVAGRWYGGMGFERWPVGTVDPAQQLAAFRVTDWEVDGTKFPVDPDCVLTLTTDDSALGLYNVFVRFSQPGVHTVKIFGRQLADFRFFAPFAIGPADPLGLDGRRVFVRGEVVGDVFDGQFVHSYELHVGRENDDGGVVLKQ